MIIESLQVFQSNDYLISCATDFDPAIMFADMDKNNLLKILISKLETDFQTLKQAALATYEDATHEESKPENKYDTRALEASYLAGAQAQRVSETSEVLLFCQNLKIREHDKVVVGAYLETQCGEKENYFFYLPKGGGITVHADGKSIQVLTPSSPLGKAIQGLRVGDSAEILMGGAKKTYDINLVI